MTNVLNAKTALDVAIKASLEYANVVTDHDPDDGAHVAPGELRRFLARLRLLHGVPFNYLVPDAQLLPLESIRFFHVDRAWTDAAVQGALSVGTITTVDRGQLEAVYPRIRDEVDETERTIRRPQGEERLQGPAGTISGFLMRSRVVSGWPNLHVRAYSRDVANDDALTTEAESHPSRLKVLRLERLAPAVLLALFDGVPAVVHIEEPRQGIQCGVRMEASAPSQPHRAKLRVRDNLTGEPVSPAALTTANAVDVPFRKNAPGVINLTALRERLAAKAPHAGGALDPHEYALQMLRFPVRQVFGDPNDTEDKRFFGLDRFQVTIPLSAWNQTVASKLGVQP